MSPLFQQHELAPTPMYNSGCGHLYCKDCIESYHLRDPNAGCPTCRAPLMLHYTPSHASATPYTTPRTLPITSFIHNIYATTEADASDRDLQDALSSYALQMPERRALESARQKLHLMNDMQEMLLRENKFNAAVLENLTSQLDVASKALRQVQKHHAQEQEDLAKRIADREHMEAVFSAAQSEMIIRL
ncbi:hypothetical protein FOMPIDRAFT_1023187 [Fomitopsis schrenkii]|uniref:RING-type domain-containing protein n=1 Tax=Fomitopsis schrenkii TaxID=2126942 RepID=S8E9U6_FOMSC|nr:hypothetical protein FOMPIDRAFT_1023187 [Fomitopsis schrenkii]